MMMMMKRDVCEMDTASKGRKLVLHGNCINLYYYVVCFYKNTEKNVIKIR